MKKIYPQRRTFCVDTVKCGCGYRQYDHIIYHIAQMQDITAKKLAEKKFKEGKKNYFKI